MHTKSTALDVALRALALRARSEKEIVEKLSQKGFDEREIAQAMAKLAEHALVDDKAFAGQWASYRVRRGMGPYRIAQELRQKGVDRETSDDALANLNEDSMLESARELAEKHLRRGGNNARQRAQAALMRRGFGFDVIRRALDSAAQAIEEDSEFDTE